MLAAVCATAGSAATDFAAPLQPSASLAIQVDGQLTEPVWNQAQVQRASAFADWQVPGAGSGIEGAFQTRGVVLVPEDLAGAEWPARAARAGLTAVALHDGPSLEHVVEFIDSPAGREFLDSCSRLGLHVEYELHAMHELLPRELFAKEPDLFRMNDQGRRTPDANLCVHSERALEIVATNAPRLARQLQPTTSRYFFGGDDGLPWCRCARCRGLSDSDQALILENRLVQELRAMDPDAQLAYLAYANTMPAPSKVKPGRGVFLEFAPIRRRYDVPYAQQTGPETKDTLAMLEENLRVFPAATAEALEYWLDASRFSQWKRPAVEVPWRREVFAADARSYAAAGIRHITTFAVWVDRGYLKRFGEPAAVQEYGELLRHSG
jgi:hypothetical protein